MGENKKKVVVLVHGWSVYNTNTYGKLAARLKREFRGQKAPEIDIVNIWLGKYVSFSDEIKVTDLAVGLENAVQKQLGQKIQKGQRCVFITHSTGGPVVREWWNQFYLKKKIPCPMSHLIMLAPANFGSALAHLGKSRLSRIKSWFERVEPGQGVLNWLELGSERAWELNRSWISSSKDPAKNKTGVFQFVLTGQTIDRKLYDHVNPYSGELGSDGVVRVAAANMNANYIKLEQDLSEIIVVKDSSTGIDEEFSALKLSGPQKISPRVAFVLIKGRSHSGKDMGILRTIKNNAKPHPTVDAIIKCIKVRNYSGYEKIISSFEEQNREIFTRERLETEEVIFGYDRKFIHDRNSMIIFRFRDNKGFPIHDFDLILTGEKNDPNRLPPGFLVDKQRNKLNPEVITMHLNYDIMIGCEPIKDKNNKEIRPSQKGLKELGLIIKSRPDTGYVHYKGGLLQADLKNMKKFLKPDQTILVDVVLKRVVHEGVFELTTKEGPEDFRKQPKGDIIK